ncbi:hypothetical protein ROJ8625_01624 [Roseivivax jejudonensis]|uniref:Uncharacterized protein n=1 Tax=Roseivivax jejudonensis TaxID=1529041 RepID=A0A1X6Z008_9RHOB|nr:DUF6525 family protein [Roseivivax jejudonensis]SLN34505.1 hypothetical protein ROJ8625_01624 [Roseivivax jejudonensis]
MARITRRGNARSSLRRRTCIGDPMKAYDRLPPELRAWLTEAALPWSARSARRAWQRALRETGGDTKAASERLSHIEQANLAKDSPNVWGTRSGR